jgi:hypothetical protein
MEDIPRDVQKELESYKVPKKTRKTGHWTLLFIGDQGEVITIRKFKGLLLLAIFIMVVALSTAVSVYMLYKKPFEENRRLEAKMVMAAGQIRALGEERDLLLTRLGIAESRLKKLQPPEAATEPSDRDGTEPASETATASPEQAQASAVAPAEAVRVVPVQIEKPEPPMPPGDTNEAVPEVKVDVRDFQVRHDPAEKLLNVQFRLKNVNVEAGQVSGRTFVVLENTQGAEIEPLTFPKVALVDGKPARIHLGRYFSISRFNIVKFKSLYDQPPRPFNRATVFVYSGAGDLLLEKHFGIENPFNAPTVTVPDPNENQADEAGATDDGPQEQVPNNTILNN